MTPVLSARQALASPLVPHSHGTSTAIPIACSTRSTCRTRCRRPNVTGALGLQTFANSHRSATRISSKKEAAGAEPNGNVNEDLDDELDKLLDEYGEIVFTNPDQRPPSAEADDDAESLSLAVALAKAASDVKAADIQVLCVKPLVYWTRFFIIATAFSRPQIDAIGSKIRDIAEMQFNKFPTGDLKPNSWTLLDFGDVVVHIFLPQQRAFYNLEEFYGNATLVELPFETRITRQE